MKPIIFSAESVKAILGGRKTQTRRVIKPQPMREINDWKFDAEPGERVIYRNWLYRLEESSGRNKRDADELYPRKIKCHYGKPGDKLYVKETWALCNDGKTVFYKSDKYDIPFIHSKWKSPIFMPRWASRILLEITDLRVERLHDISDYDIINEGIIPPEIDIAKDKFLDIIIEKFIDLWDSINAKRGYPFKSNPWV